MRDELVRGRLGSGLEADERRDRLAVLECTMRDLRVRTVAAREEGDDVVERFAPACATTLPHEAARAVVTLGTALPQWFRPDGPATAGPVAQQYVAFALDLVRCGPARGPARG